MTSSTCRASTTLRLTIADDLVAQTHQCFTNIATALGEAGATLDDVVRVRYLLTDAADFERVAPLFGTYFAIARPAATAMVVGLVEPRMRIEIEVTARVPAIEPLVREGGA